MWLMEFTAGGDDSLCRDLTSWVLNPSELLVSEFLCKFCPIQLFLLACCNSYHLCCFHLFFYSISQISMHRSSGSIVLSTKIYLNLFSAFFNHIVILMFISCTFCSWKLQLQKLVLQGGPFEWIIVYDTPIQLSCHLPMSGVICCHPCHI
jgi:hypothetical protein